MSTLPVRSALCVCFAIVLLIPAAAARDEERPAAPPVNLRMISEGGATEKGLRIEKDASSVRILAGGGNALEYAFAGVPFKPYAKAFHTPTGLNVLRDSPEDHKHHHALMYAIAVDGVTFWAETEEAGKQSHRDFAVAAGEEAGDIKSARLVERLDWRAPGEKGLVLSEERTIRVFDPTDLGASILTWSSALRAAEGKASVKLGGDHYYGLGARFLTSMDQNGKFLNAEGKEGELVRGDERLAPGRWCAYVAKADGKPVTVAMFDSPSNPREVLWFTMKVPFAYLSATVNLWREPIELEAGKTLRFTYGVAVADGEANAEAIQALFQKWLAVEGAYAKAAKEE